MLMNNIKQAGKDPYDPYRPLAAPAGAERLAFENPMYGNGNGNRNAVSNPTYADDAGQPEVMVLQRPLVHFHADVSEQVLKVLQRHVENRGLHLAPETKGTRRPRTVFLTVESPDQAKFA